MKLAVLPAPLEGLPWRVLLPLTLLVCFGSAVLYSAAGGSLQPFALDHLIRFSACVVMALILRLIPRELVTFGAYPAYAAVLLMLIVVDAIGVVGGGAQRWIDIGFMQLQPSEFMKPCVVLVLAQFYSSLPPGMIGTWRSLVPAGMLLGVPVALVLVQPDLGTSMAIAFGGFIVMFLAGLPVKWFVGGGLAAMVAAPMAYFFVLHDYQRNRVTTFLDPESDPLGTGYHITQSKIAIGSGGITGKGFGEGSQSHLNYLPEPHTDFVFATMAEEWGLLGGLLVLLIFGIVLRWGWTVARRAPDRFSRLLAGGMTATIFFYAAINLLMVMGLAPVVGIPLPFMSHGGSSMLTNMICLGTLMMVDRWTSRTPRSGLA